MRLITAIFSQRADGRGAGLKPAPTSFAVALILLLALHLASPAIALEFPALTGRVVDDAGVLDTAQRAALTDKLAALEAKTTDQLVVVTLKSLQGTSIEDFGVELGRHWQIGQKDKNNGVLLIVAPNERKVRIEVGYGLEGTLTDAVSRLIIENSIIPRFRANDFAGGVSRGVDDIISVLTGDAEEWKARAAPRPDTGPTWAGAVLIWLLAMALLLFMYWMIGGAVSTQQSRRRSRGASGPWIIPGSGWSSGSGGFSGGGFSGGGGFTGGGGSFGGGGASGSW
jgi:uncharacterized protein